MLKPLSLLCFSLLLAGCLSDESVSGYAGGIWLLDRAGPTRIDSSARITLDLTSRGRISGRGPCNSYSATQIAPYPWFEAGPITSTRAACPELAAEQAYLNALSRMSLAEVSGPMLILSNDAGDTLQFRLHSAP